jgi:3-isopropylmalate/(R)-2-methylmalate dehydratase small subunit
LTTGVVTDKTNGAELTFGKIPEVMLGILNEGGLIPYISKYGSFGI